MMNMTMTIQWEIIFFRLIMGKKSAILIQNMLSSPRRKLIAWDNLINVMERSQRSENHLHRKETPTADKVTSWLAK